MDHQGPGAAQHVRDGMPSPNGHVRVRGAYGRHTALVPVYLAAKYRPYGVYQSARSILAIHNLKHQVRSSGIRRCTRAPVGCTRNERPWRGVQLEGR